MGNLKEREVELDKISMNFKDLKNGILKFKAKSEYQQAAIVILRQLFIDEREANKVSASHEKEDETLADVSKCGARTI